MTISIDKLGMKRFNELCKYWQRLLNQKMGIINTLTIHGVSYDGIKVTSGNGKRLTEQERFVIALERIDNELKSVTKELEEYKQVLLDNIKRLTPISSKIIQLRYIDQWQTWQVIEDLFIGDPRWNPNMDLEEFKKTPEYDYFRKYYYKLENTAINQLVKVTGQAFVPNQNQLRVF